MLNPETPGSDAPAAVQHARPFERLGAFPCGEAGVRFALWAPHASAVRVVGDFNGWNGARHAMHREGDVWELQVPEARAGQRYRFELRGAAGASVPAAVQKADPFAHAAELRPNTASVIAPLPARRPVAPGVAARNRRDAPVSIYEVHLGSWRRTPDGSFLDWDAVAATLPDYVASLGFTHVELMPVSEHPFDGSWGYQALGQYAPSARFGPPEGLRRFVDACHARRLGVLLDWVPAHFPVDAHGLARFDGQPLYEYADPRQGFHPEWGTFIYDFGKPEVADFLAGSALYWVERFGVDGLRVDAVTSMLYRDYSRPSGDWVPNVEGGRYNLEAIALLRRINEVLARECPGAVTMAEESTTFPGVTRAADEGGLGFGFKWNLGWMHDSLVYMAQPPALRTGFHECISFGLVYAFDEQFVLPLSHDEVVHGKGSLLSKMPGDDWQKHANLRALYGYMWAHPGKKLLFMGGELAQEQEWSHTRSIDWHLTERPRHAGVQRLVRDLNHVYRDHPQLWELDNDPAGFRWLVVDDRDANVVAFARFSAHGAAMVAVANMSPVPRPAYRLPVPHGGRWREILNTDAEIYGGANLGNLGVVHAEEKPWGGESASVELMLPPLGVIWLSPDE